jgi:hypothetical protein
MKAISTVPSEDYDAGNRYRENNKCLVEGGRWKEGRCAGLVAGRRNVSAVVFIVGPLAKKVHRLPSVVEIFCWVKAFWRTRNDGVIYKETQSPHPSSHLLYNTILTPCRLSHSPRHCPAIRPGQHLPSRTRRIRLFTMRAISPHGPKGWISPRRHSANLLQRARDRRRSHQVPVAEPRRFTR